jgi:hypothetical protein
MKPKAWRDKKCAKCNGLGWVCGIHLDNPDDDTSRDTETHYTCDRCDGTGNDGEWKVVRHETQAQA